MAWDLQMHPLEGLGLHYESHVSLVITGTKPLPDHGCINSSVLMIFCILSHYFYILRSYLATERDIQAIPMACSWN